MFFLTLVTVLLVAPAWAASPDPKPDMHALAAEISVLQKYILSDAEFGAPANGAAIENSLSSLRKHLDHLGKDTFANDPSLRANLALLNQHISDADRAFHSGNKAFSRSMMQSSLQMCIACHTRKNSPDFSWPEPDAPGISPLNKADYYFATRQFAKGLTVYEDVVEGFPQNHSTQWELRKALLAIAVYYARVVNKPELGAKYFLKVSTREEFPIYLRRELAAWATEFKDWNKEVNTSVSPKAGEATLLLEAKKILKHDDFSLISDGNRSFHVRRLRASVLLQRVLEMPGERSPRKAEAMLFLGRIYARISSEVFFRFGPMYLKACITEYPKTATAHSCYEALEEILTEGYSGSAGTNIPEDEQVELFRLKRLAF